jgi:pullulanase
MSAPVFRITCALALAGHAALVLAAPRPEARPSLADCDTTEHYTVLQAAPAQALPAPAEARAVWLDGQRLRWPGVSAAPGTRFRLLHSSQGQLQALPGERARGVDHGLTLRAADTPLPPALAERFRWVGAGQAGGVDLALRPADRAGLPRWLRGQLLLVQEDRAGRVLQATAVQVAGALDALYAPAAQVTDLGAYPQPGRTTFKLWAPTAQDVTLCLYPDGHASAGQLLPLRRDARTGVWSASAARDLHGHTYLYLVDVYVRGLGRVRQRVTDPYAVSLNADSRRAAVLDLDRADLKPADWDSAQPPTRVQHNTDMVVYELHVRDFSRDDPKVPAALRGKYGAFALPDSAGLQHLKALSQAGVTDVHLLPVFDLATVPEEACVSPPAEALKAAPDSPQQQAAVQAVAARDCFNWGYDPLHYTAPEGSYASNAADPAVRVREFRAMVMGLHALGLRVGMDVVYNHTSASGQHLNSVLDRIVPGYYQRYNAQGGVENSTCCDNTATENLMMAKLMVDSAVVWARDYRIDGFRFDLMGHQPRAVMEGLQKAVNAAARRPVQLLGEGWNFGEVADGARFVQASQLSLNGSGIATFSDRARDAIRGGSAGDNGLAQMQRQGYISGLQYARNATVRQEPQALRAELLRSADLVRLALAGTLRTYSFTTHTGEVRRGEQIDYAGQPAGYASQPGEVVNYVENHDNQTLFDALVFKLPADTTPEDRARVQTLGAALNAFSQGVAYFHAGQDVLRSKSMDRNSYDSGDHFNRLDWTLQDNGFGAGLPPERDNGTSWPLMKPLLAQAHQLKPTPELMRWTRDAFLDLLRIRNSSSLFRLRTADEVQARLTMHNTGPTQQPTVIAATLDGRGHAGAGFSELLLLVNVDTQARTLPLPALQGRAYTLHPVHLARTAADRRPADLARWDAGTGTATVPARTAMVYVLR